MTLASPAMVQPTKAQLKVSRVASLTNVSVASYNANYGSQPSGQRSPSASSVATFATSRYPPRRRKESTVNLKDRKGIRPQDVDLLEVEDADELFLVFGVKDVRSLEKRARASADSKRDELKTMVGERYRDLLSAASSILRMRASSNAFISHVSLAKSLCSMQPASPVIPSAPEVPADKERYTLSTLVSLLLSIPESVYRSLESNAFLDAALLDGLGKAVYSELLRWGEDEDSDEEEAEDGEKVRWILKTFPLIIKQWERLKGLGDIVSRRARSSLTSWKVGPTMTAETLAALVLLEANSIPESLELLLTMRSKALQTNLAKSISTDNFSANETTIQDSLELILSTSAHVDQLFVGDHPKLLCLLERIQDSPISKDVSQTALDPNSIVALLHSLPSSHLLLRYLPSHILSFAPFIDTRSDRNLFPTSTGCTSILQSWIQRSQREFGNGFKEMLTHIQTGRQLHLLREKVEAFLRSTSTRTEETNALLQEVIKSLKQRLEEIYTRRLEAMVDSWTQLVQRAFTSPLGCIDPLFDLNGIAWPPAAMPNALSTRDKDPFDIFKRLISRKINGRSDCIENCLASVENEARMLKDDLGDWLDAEEGEHYLLVVQTSLNKIHSSLEAQSNILAGIPDIDVNQFVLIGHLALALRASTQFTTNLVGLFGKDERTSVIVADFHSKLFQLQASTLERWVSYTVQQAVHGLQEFTSALQPSTSSFVPPSIIIAQPSDILIRSLQCLVCSLEKLGPQRLHADQLIHSNIMAQYRTRILEISEGLLEAIVGIENDNARISIASQTLWDIKFLALVWDEDRFDKVERLKFSGIQEQLSVLANEEVILDPLIHLKRTQTLYTILLPPQSKWMPFSAPSPLEREGLARGIGVETAVVGARLGLLPVR